MNELDQLIEEQTPEVAKAINDLIERAGTSDADWDVLLEAGNMIAELRNPISSAIIHEMTITLMFLGASDVFMHYIACWQDASLSDSLVLERLKLQNEKLADTLQWQIDSYNRNKPSYDEAEFNLMVDKGTKAWADVPDASAWVDELRGDDEP